MRRWLVVAALLGASVAGWPSVDAAPSANSSRPGIGPPFYGTTTLGYTYRSANSPNKVSCPEMREFYGDCWYHPYPAVDFGTKMGKPIRAVADGTVAVVDEETDADPDAWPRRPGRFVLLTHEDTDAPPVTAYKHLSGWAVAEGQTVIRGQVIGYAGDTQAGGVHLHFDAFDSVAGFNLYEHQVGYGVMSWCNSLGQNVSRTFDGSAYPEFLMGQTYTMLPC